jgi:hypothetical protein
VEACHVCSGLKDEKHEANTRLNDALKQLEGTSSGDRRRAQLDAEVLKAQVKQQEILAREEKHWQQPEHHNAFKKNRRNPEAGAQCDKAELVPQT